MKKYIKGIYKRSIYKSDKGYIIGIFKISDTNDELMEDFIGKNITFTGSFHELTEDEEYLFYGECIDHPRYGFQYQVTEYEKVLPQDKDGIIAFLSSGLFKGIGAKLAGKIVDTLGEDALNKILEDPSCLNLVPKLTTKKIDDIYNTLNRYAESHETIVYLTELGFTMRDALEIYNVYKNNTKAKIDQNIYDLINDISEVTFPKIDTISLKLDISREDFRRIKASILYTITNLIYTNGDTYLEFDEIYDATCKYLRLELNISEFEQYLSELVNERKIYKEEAKYYLYDMYMAERNIILKIKKLITKEKDSYIKLDKRISELEEINDITYNKKQKDAIKKALQNNILIITGGPGTGKTTIIKAITELYIRINELKENEISNKIALLAPTGRASKRMSEATLLPAYTIHRYLKWNKETNKFAVDEYNKNNHHLIIVDEVSMIDINLLDSLLRGLTDNIKLILVGDYHQLPSVGPGQILKDLIESATIETIELDLLYRQDETSYIPILAHEIKNNNLNNNFIKQKDDYKFIECNNISIRKNIKNICEKLVLKNYDYKKVQFMAPMYRGENGIDNLNKELQEVFNPKDASKRELIYGDVTYRENDKILQLVNMPDENVYNGDIGIIKRIVFANESEDNKNEIHVEYDGMIVKYLPNDFHKIRHGFIISIHKSQGSEFDIVIIPICNSYKRMLYKKLIYTGITRAKKKLIIIGETDAFLYSINNNSEVIRKTNLLEKLKLNIV